MMKPAWEARAFGREQNKLKLSIQRRGAELLPA
jgi:hypothetical protein